MPPVAPVAIVIDSDLGVLSRAERALKTARYQALSRLSPSGLLDVLRAVRPELILLGLPFWDEGWGPVLRSASPETVVFPLGDPTEGGVETEGLSALLRRGAA